jgi:hypothetical protein
MSEPALPTNEEDEGALDEGTELQFDEAEPTTPASSGPTCAGCKRPINDAYFEINGKVVCTSCRRHIENSFRGGSAAGRVIKATVFGAAGMIVGALLYYSIVRATGAYIRLVAVVVGFIVGGAVRKGSENRGGSFYQFLAVVLTYTAIGLMELVSHAGPQQNAAPQVVAPQPAWVIFLSHVIGIFILPVIRGYVQPISGLIYCFALWEAWKINKRARLVFNGPFQISAAPAVRAPEVSHDGA